MPIVVKEVIRPGTYFYKDQDSGLPRKLTVTPELASYWHDQGNAMLADKLSIPVPMEHDFDAHPMTPAEKLKSNSGWVDSYFMRKVKNKDGGEVDALFSRLDIQDPEVAKKLPTTIRWTSPWINSFTDGNGKEWKNVISHLALTSRPRVVDQEPFGSVAAALSLAEPIKGWGEVGDGGLCLSRAGLLLGDAPAYPMAFSMAFAWTDASRKKALETRKRNALAKKSGSAPTTTPRASDKPKTPKPQGDAEPVLPKTATPQGDAKESGGFWSGVKDFFTGKKKKERLKDFTSGKSGHKALRNTEKAEKNLGNTGIGHWAARESGRANYLSKKAVRSGSVDDHKKAAEAHDNAHNNHSDSLKSGYGSRWDHQTLEALRNAVAAHKTAADEHRKHHSAAMSMLEVAFSHASGDELKILMGMPFESGDVALSYPHGSNQSAQAQAMWTKDPHGNDYEDRTGHEYGRAPGWNKKKKGKKKATGRRRKKRVAGKSMSIGLALSLGKMKSTDDTAYEYEDTSDPVDASTEYEYEMVDAVLGTFPPLKSKQPPVMDDDSNDISDDPTADDEIQDDGDPTNDDDDQIDIDGDGTGDVGMTEVLCDLLGALGIHVEHDGDEATFKRSIYNAAMTKVHDLTGKAQADDDDDPNRQNPPGQPPNNPDPNNKAQQKQKQQNPLIQQEQQPMYMSLDEINALQEPLKSVALSMYKENQKLRKDAAADRKKLESLNASKLREEDGKRQQRVQLLGKLAPRSKGILDAMLASPAMALSMGDGGRVSDPMSQTLAVLEAGLADMPSLLTTDHSFLSVAAHPTDMDMLNDERTDALADSMARAMGCPPVRQAG